MRSSILSLLTGFMVFATQAQATTETHVSNDFGFIASEIQKLAAKNTPSEILIAFDIDKTLLIVQDCLPEGESKGLAGWMKMVGKCPADVTDPRVAASVATLQEAGFHTLALTARPASVKAATLRELRRNKIEFAGRPFDATSNFTQKFPKGADLVFEAGVSYANGRNKGFILQQLQLKQAQPYELVVFVDDDSKNIRNMESAYADDPQTHVIIYHYNQYK
jgi:hypothetical protein